MNSWKNWCVLTICSLPRAFLTELRQPRAHQRRMSRWTRFSVMPIIKRSYLRFDRSTRTNWRNMKITATTSAHTWSVSYVNSLESDRSVNERSNAWWRSFERNSTLFNFNWNKALAKLWWSYAQDFSMQGWPGSNLVIVHRRSALFLDGNDETSVAAPLKPSTNTSIHIYRILILRKTSRKNLRVAVACPWLR